MFRCALLLVLLASMLPAPAAEAALFDWPFILRFGDAKPVGLDGLMVGFEGVQVESRCPIGVFCVWEGDAECLLWMQPPGGEAEYFALHTYHVWDQHHDVGPYRMILLEVEPYPVFGEPIAPQDYFVTVLVTDYGPVDGDDPSWGAIKSLYR